MHEEATQDARDAKDRRSDWMMAFFNFIEMYGSELKQGETALCKKLRKTPVMGRVGEATW